MPAFNQPADAWFPNRLGRAMSDVDTLKRQGTEYIVNENRECVAIVGNLENAPTYDPSTNETGTEATGLTGWGIAALTPSGWKSLATDPAAPVTVLPVSPVDGQTVDYLADATGGVIWRLRYRASSPSEHKWEFVGGSPLSTGATGSITTTSAALVALTGGPSLTVPLAGDYLVEGSAEIVGTVAGLAEWVVRAGVTATGCTGRTGAVAFNVGMGERALADLAAAAVLTMAVANQNEHSTTFNFGSIWLTPVRVG